MSSIPTAGTQLPEWSVPITATLVVSTAIATRDFQDVHHDRDLARAAGSRDIFVNILTSNGLVERYVTDALGHDLNLKAIAIRLGAPAHPGDTLTFSGTVESVDGGTAVVSVRGTVRPSAATAEGDRTAAGQPHVTGKVTVQL